VASDPMATTTTIASDIDPLLQSFSNGANKDNLSDFDLQLMTSPTMDDIQFANFLNNHNNSGMIVSPWELENDSPSSRNSSIFSPVSKGSSLSSFSLQSPNPLPSLFPDGDEGNMKTTKNTSLRSKRKESTKTQSGSASKRKSLPTHLEMDTEYNDTMDALDEEEDIQPQEASASRRKSSTSSASECRRRNAMAARKCREKRRKEHEILEGAAKDMQVRNQILMRQCQSLREDLYVLKNLALMHVGGACDSSRLLEVSVQASLPLKAENLPKPKP
jgi:hypothetical protein